MEEDIKDKQIEQINKIDDIELLKKENKRLKERVKLLESQLRSPEDIGDFIYQEYIR